MLLNCKCNLQKYMRVVKEKNIKFHSSQGNFLQRTFHGEFLNSKNFRTIGIAEREKFHINDTLIVISNIGNAW